MIPTAVGLSILILLVCVNWRLGKSFLYPPTQFSMVWCVLVGLSLLIGTDYFPLSVLSICIYCLGAFAFSAGGAVRSLISHERSTWEQPDVRYGRNLNRALTFSFIALLAVLPYFWMYMSSLADPKFRNFWWGMRAGVIAAAEAQGMKNWQQTLFDNITILATLLAFTATAHFGERLFSRVTACGLITLATLYNLGTASRAGAASVVLGCLGIRMIRLGRLSVWQLVTGTVGVLVMYVPITMLRATGGNMVEIAASDVSFLSDTAMLYTAGPLTAFDSYLQHPTSLPDTWSVSFFFLHAANRMGFDVYAPSTHVGYMAIAPSTTTNLYTMYFAYYPDFGILGVVVFAGLVGYLLVWLYQAASSYKDYLLVLYAFAFDGICKSGMNESFILALNQWLKAAAYCLVLYAVHRAWQDKAPSPAVPSRLEEEATCNVPC